jgi:hypothetical protein
MSASGEFDRYGIYAARIGDMLLRDVDEIKFGSASNKNELIAGGNILRSSVLNSHADPMFSSRTRDLINLLSGSSYIPLMTGYACNINAGSPTAPSLFQFQKRADGSTFAGSNHQVLTSNKGFAICGELSAAQDDVEGIKASVEYYCLSVDGQTVPITQSSTSLTSTPNPGSQFFMGPVWTGDLNSTPLEIKGIQSWRYVPGVTYSPKRASGNPFAMVGSIVKQAPELRINTADIGAFNTIMASAHFGKTIASPDRRITCYGQLGVVGGSGRVPKATPSHFKITFSLGDCTVDSIGVEGQADGSTDVVFRPTELPVLTFSVAIQADA